MADKTYHMTIPSSTRHLSEIRRFVEQHAREAQLSEADVDKFRLAVDEACTNVIEHACKGDETYRITITINIKGPRVTMLIRDDGEAFDPEKYAPPNLIEMAEKRRDGGFGIHLMRSLMDRVEYRRRGRFNEVALTKYVSDPAQNGS